MTPRLRHVHLIRDLRTLRDLRDLRHLRDLLHIRQLRHIRQLAIAAPALLTLNACAPEPGEVPAPTPRHPPSAQVPLSPSRPPIDPARVQRDVEGHGSWPVPRKAACPRRIPDRIEERRPFPAIAILEGLGFVTITDDSSRGMYEKVIELTSEGRFGLGAGLEEESDRYIVTIARREYVPGREQYTTVSGREHRVSVEVFWRWKPVNPLGERLNLSAPDGDALEHHGRATYERSGEEWSLVELWLDRNNRDYVGGVYQ